MGVFLKADVAIEVGVALAKGVAPKVMDDTGDSGGVLKFDWIVSSAFEEECVVLLAALSRLFLACAMS